MGLSRNYYLMSAVVYMVSAFLFLRPMRPVFFLMFFMLACINFLFYFGL